MAFLLNKKNNSNKSLIIIAIISAVISGFIAYGAPETVSTQIVLGLFILLSGRLVKSTTLDALGVGIIFGTMASSLL